MTRSITCTTPLVALMSVATIVATVRMSIKGIEGKLNDMQSKMDGKDAEHDRSISELRDHQGDIRERLGIVESRLDQTIRHIGEQLGRIHDKLFGP